MIGSASHASRADVVIVGAGPAGAVAARRFTEAGMRVVCLEQGTWPDYSTSHVADEFLELSAAKPWSPLPSVRRGPNDYPIDTTQSDVEPLMWNGVGGSTVMYAGIWMRLMPSDFRVRTLDGVADDWPLSYEDLSPYYERIEADFGVSGHPGDPAFPDIASYPMKPAPIGRGGRMMAEAHNRLGWHWWPGSNAIATEKYRNQGACEQLGGCMWGCPNRSKASPEITHWPDLIRQGATLITGATAHEIETDARGLATGVVYVDADGVTRRQEADLVVVAANGIGTPRLLQLSTSARFPDGLANTSGMVGKRLMMHPFATVVGVFDEQLDPWKSVWGQPIYSLEFYETVKERGFVRGAKWNVTPTGGPQSMTAAFPWGGRPIWGDDFHETVKDRLGRSLAWGIVAEDLPEEHNRVELDHSALDRTGLPGARMHYTTSQNTLDLLAFNVERAQESLVEAGAKETLVAPMIRETGWHILGTATMGADPATSVVDQWGRAHDVPNLLIVDGSTWPTSSGMNPTPTIAAFSLRAAEHAVAHRSSQAVAS
jgi:choline dehydrogenase-like flavoprotein